MSYSQLLSPDEAVPSNPQWHKLRAEGVSASEIAAVLGISPWDSPFSLYWQKVNGWTSDENPEMSAGKRAEQVVADWYADVADPNETLVIHSAGLYSSTERPWQLATPDRLICDPQMHENPFPYDHEYVHRHDIASVVALLECKYVIGGWDGWGEQWTDEIPVHYRAQCLWQLDVMGVHEVHLAAWHGADLRIYRVTRDEKDLRIMRAAGEQFHRRLLDGNPPDIDDHTATIRTLKALHPSLDDRKQPISDETAAGFLRVKALKKRVADLEDRYEARLRHEMGNAVRAVTSTGANVASRSIYERKPYEVGAATIDKLNPARGKKS